MNKKILITGINGFIGSHCAKYFEQKGYEVFGIDLYGGNSSNFFQGEVSLDNIKSFNTKFDIIIHLAGSGTVGLAQNFPEREYAKTVGSVEHILEYIRLHNPNAKLIYSSSAAVYGDLHDDLINEEVEINPISIYGKHKQESEKICKEYHQNFGLKINIVRFFSIYGDGLQKQLLWDFCNRVVKSRNLESLDCFGTGNEKRDFIHIQDAIKLIEVLIEKEIDFETINGATGKATKVTEVLQLICDELGFEGELVFDNIVKEGDPKSLVANIERARTLGFNPNIKVEDGIRKYIEWFRENN